MLMECNLPVCHKSLPDNDTDGRFATMGKTLATNRPPGNLRTSNVYKIRALKAMDGKCCF